MARSVEDSLTLLETSRSNIVTSLNKKGSNVSTTLKISEVAGKIDGITTKGATIIVTAPGFEGQTLTATKGSKKFTGVVKSGTCEITVDESGTWIVSAVSGQSVEVSVSVGVPCTLNKGKIFTYVVNQAEADPSLRVSYRDDALGKTPAKMNYSTGKFEYGDWANEFFITKNHVYAVSQTGVIAGQCQDNDYSKFTTGAASNYNNATAHTYNFMASFPTCWIWRRMEGNNRVVSIADYKVDNNYHAYGWENQNGHVQEFMYVSAFQATKFTNIARSIAGQNGRCTELSEKYSNVKTYSEANGTGWTTLDFCKWSAIQDLAVLISKSTNSQTAFGMGCEKTVQNTGYLYNKGQFWGSQKDQDLPVKLFHIENLWGAETIITYGITLKSDGYLYIKTHMPYNNDGSGYTKITNVYISKTTAGFSNSGVETEYGYFPTSFNGSETTYDCDRPTFVLPTDGGYNIFCPGGTNTHSYANYNGILCYYFQYSDTAGGSPRSTLLTYTPQVNTGITA